LQVYIRRASRACSTTSGRRRTRRMAGSCGVGSNGPCRATATCALSPVARPRWQHDCRADQVGTTTSGNYILQSPTGFTASAALGVSVWIRRVISTNTSRAAPRGAALYGEFRADLSAIGGEWVQLSYGGVYQTTAWAASGTGGGGIALAALAAPWHWTWVRVWQQEGMLGPDAEVQASPLSVAANLAGDSIPSGNRCRQSTRSGVRTVLDLTGNTSPLAIALAGVGRIGRVRLAAVLPLACDWRLPMRPPTKQQIAAGVAHGRRHHRGIVGGTIIVRTTTRCTPRVDFDGTPARRHRLRESRRGRPSEAWSALGASTPSEPDFCGRLRLLASSERVRR
jgi:hypothetical protein